MNLWWVVDGLVLGCSLSLGCHWLVGVLIVVGVDDCLLIQRVYTTLLDLPQVTVLGSLKWTVPLL